MLTDYQKFLASLAKRRLERFRESIKELEALGVKCPDYFANGEMKFLDGLLSGDTEQPKKKTKKAKSAE